MIKTFATESNSILPGCQFSGGTIGNPWKHTSGCVRTAQIQYHDTKAYSLIASRVPNDRTSPFKSGDRADRSIRQPALPTDKGLSLPNENTAASPTRPTSGWDASRKECAQSSITMMPRARREKAQRLISGVQHDLPKKCVMMTAAIPSPDTADSSWST